MRLLLALALAPSAACVADVPVVDTADNEDVLVGQEPYVEYPDLDDPDGAVDDPGTTLSHYDDFAPLVAQADDGYVPRAFNATRFGVFYQISLDVVANYENPTTGLPHRADHGWLITHSHPGLTTPARRALADLVHQRDDFYYAPSFDLHKYTGWETASDAQLQQWAHDYRDAVITAHGDLFTFNECPSHTGSNPTTQAQIAKILRYIHEPDASGRQLWGVVYLTEQAATPSKWTGPGNDFFRAVDETSVALVAEHYHSTAFMCKAEDALANHFFAMRRWLAASSEPAKRSIASHKFVVLHSSRFSPGASAWAGGNSDTTSLAKYRRALARVAKVTRDTPGGANRLSFGPVTTTITDLGVMPRIDALFDWHYGHAVSMTSERGCLDGNDAACSCDWTD